MQAGCPTLRLEYAQYVDPTDPNEATKTKTRLKTVYADIYKTPSAGTGPRSWTRPKLVTDGYETVAPFRLLTMTDERGQRTTKYG